MMTKKTAVFEQPAYTYNVDTYCCDICGFKSEEEDEVKIHYGSNHAIKETKEIGGKVFLWFDSKDDMEAWSMSSCLNPYSDGRYDEACVEEDWHGKGWYIQYMETTPCGRGCCTKMVLCFDTVEKWIGKLEREIDAKQKNLQNVKLGLFPKNGA